MKKEYKQIYSAGFNMPALIATEVDGESPKYSYNKENISEQDFFETLKKIKRNPEFGGYQKITILDDNGQNISEVEYTNNDVRSSIYATVKVGDETFTYKQIQQKQGKLDVNGRSGTTYMLIKKGDEHSEYLDRQPRLDDHLLDVRDEILAPYLAVFDGSKKLSELDVANTPSQRGEY